MNHRVFPGPCASPDGFARDGRQTPGPRRLGRRIVAGLLALLAVAGLAAAGPGPDSRTEIRRHFKETQKLARHRGDALFGVFRDRLTAAERDALEFLYAYMPLADLADHDGAFYLAAVRASLRARRELPWGPQIPEELFRHFVLPLRVNNETLDTFRQDMYPELRDRVAGLTLRQAALEINHWCHERVIYHGTDARTSAPLATIRTGYGRCGEESVLAVAALRAAGIPARQCYTPRWAHTDDNHAWVEVWVDGGWHYLGACEPEPDLDLAWFREPVRRAMLVHTRVHGAYAGPEPVLERPPLGPVLNLTGRYAPLRDVRVRVVDAAGRPVAGAEVTFRLYNYAEFYPLATCATGTDGRAAVACGRGDLLVWARQDGRYGWAPSPAGDGGEVTVRLADGAAPAAVADLDLTAPPMPPPLPVPAEGQTENARRLKENDARRAGHIATFMAEPAARALAAATGQDPDAVWRIIAVSRGNWRAIEAFLRRCPPEQRAWALPLLGTLSHKDLRDAPPDVLLAHLAAALARPHPLMTADRGLFVQAVLAPRIDTETLVAWREPLRRAVPAAVARKARQDPLALWQWLQRRVAHREDRSPYRLPITPRGVLALRAADRWSGDICLVALARSLGIPARLHPALRTPEIHLDGRWQPAVPPPPAEPAPASGRLKLKTDGTAGQARYFTHFTLARLLKGLPETLEYPEGQPAAEFGAAELPGGDYLLVTGNRQHDGSVLARLAFFPLPAGGAAEVPLVLRQLAGPPRVLGRLPGDAALSGLDGSPLTLASKPGDRGFVVAWLAPGTEPTRHVLAELMDRRAALEAWGGRILLCLPADQPVPPGDGLPVTVVWVRDPDEALLAAVCAGLGATLPLRPVVLVITAAGDIVHASEGYAIGTADRILEIGESVSR